jgi:C4-dicarboxylate-specific signal transduction histidine kinase
MPWNDIVTEDTRASEVISRLRALLRKGEVKFEAVNLNDLIGSTIKLLHSELISRRIRIESDFAEDLPVIFGDCVQLEQVVLNLLMNAMEAMNSIDIGKRVIAINTRLTNAGRVEAVIADSGRGIATEHKDRLGEPFFTTKDRGLGLGLSICSAIVKSHGGVLTISGKPDGGAVATLTLETRPVANPGGAR